MFYLLNGSFLPISPFCSLLWKASSETEERGRKEGPPGVLKSSPKELRQEPGVGVAGEGLLQAQGGGRGQKPGLSQMHFFRSEGSRA